MPPPLPPASPFVHRTGLPLSRPWPLVPLALADVAYALYASISEWATVVSPLFIALAVLRFATLTGVASARRWRQRGGYVLAVAGATLIACTWEVCASMLMRHVPGQKDVDHWFLLFTSGIALFEYLFFLVLVRLAPQRTPFSLRAPPGRSPSLPLTPNVTPLPTARRIRPPLPLFTTPIPTAPVATLPPRTTCAGSYGATESAASLTATSLGAPGTSRSPLASGWEWGARGAPGVDEHHSIREADEDTYLDDDGVDADVSGYDDSVLQVPGIADLSTHHDEEMGFTGNDTYDESDDDTASTISDSSIIDLPRPRPPQPIVLPESTSLNALADIANAVEVAAGVVRRTASTRFSRSTDSEGYGTFQS